ncbi:transposase, IS481 family [Bordetella pertussis H921]|nr:transposase, IS481 family [Bordetella pertussis H921]
MSASTVSRVLARAGLSHLADWRAWCATSIRPPAICCTSTSRSWDVPPWHRVTGNRRDTVEGPAGTSSSCYDHARVAFTDIPPTSASPAPSVPQGRSGLLPAPGRDHPALAHRQWLGLSQPRLAALCHELGIKHRFTRPYRPQTNGKAERFIQSALREWAYAHTYQNSQHRADAMKSWLHHYNWHRPHQGIGRAVPISRLNLDEYNLLTVHS